jgi:homoserine dehydrogenase
MINGRRADDNFNPTLYGNDLMSKDKIINFALLGCGKLGSGFYSILKNKRNKIFEETGFQLNLKRILVKNAHYRRPSFIDRSLITANINDILEDPSIDLAIDAIGGIEPTYSIIRKLINRKIHIVSANRVLLASKMHELVDLANENNVYIQPEPSLGGGVPIISALQRDLRANNITSLTGIISGTSNFILTEMTEKKIPMEEALKSAPMQKMAESLSIIDYEGSDAAQKVSIMAASAYGVDVGFMQIYAEGISDVTAFDIECAAQFGYVFKLLAILKNHQDSVEIRVHPTLVPKEHPLALVRGEYNAYFMQTDLLGDYMLLGRGVGIEAASSLILRDILAIGQIVRSGHSKEGYRLKWSAKQIMPVEDVRTSYYVRFPCHDRPGVIGLITMTLGDFNINITSAHAESSRKENSDSGFVHILIDQATEKDIRLAIEEINRKNIICDRVKYFRIL